MNHLNPIRLLLKLRSRDNRSLVNYKLTIYENIWRAVFVVITLMGSFVINSVYKFHTSPEYDNISKPSILDFYVSVIVALIIAAIRYAIKHYLKEHIFNLLSEKRRRTQEDGMKRAEQICKWVFDVFYYSFATIWGFYLFKDEFFFPSIIGGNADCSSLGKNVPNMIPNTNVKLFYMVQTGTHLYTFVHQVIFKWSDPKYFEFVLHHGMAFFLLWFSYMMNFTGFGIIVLILHDPGDVFLILGRSYMDYKKMKLKVVIPLCCISYFVWVSTRNFIFPSCVIKGGLEALQEFYYSNAYYAEVFFFPLFYMNLMTVALACMHIYWTFFLTKASLALIFEKKDKNGYDS